MLKVKNITFGYSKTKVLNAIDFNVKAGENLAIIGESGSGKSTLLKLIYGEYDLDKGQIFWKDEEILGPKYNLVVGYEFMKSVSQEFDLMPVTTVAENIGKFLSNFYPEEKQRRTKELIEVVELEAFANTKVRMLSGGQKQRVAIARALAKQPEILLLDEPFSHIDNFQKQGLRRNVFNYLKANSIACIVATHDRNDVLGFADEIIVLDESKIIAKDTPQNLYKNPQLPLIASFFAEFNVIDPYGIVYEHQIKIVKDSNFKAIVRRAYFKGNSWLIEVDYKSESLFIEHGVELEKGLEIQFSISL
ncbi:ABC transporter ATP-binding protein [Winogradskyella undariae]|uniref:ABC transporter ATP-binding protein n=1 Tax=Winogradskyella undariae TaxID=1285465 RepID=UPI00156AA8BD|nr:ABC transporter ATP-binding protein [Winogradskyella undariae]NRR91316.1 ABC transporter ATP-binding protein [Winogradskyella undariae]